MAKLVEWAAAAILMLAQIFLSISYYDTVDSNQSEDAHREMGRLVIGVGGMGTAADVSCPTDWG